MINLVWIIIPPIAGLYFYQDEEFVQWFTPHLYEWGQFFGFILDVYQWFAWLAVQFKLGLEWMLGPNWIGSLTEFFEKRNEYISLSWESFRSGFVNHYQQYHSDTILIGEFNLLVLGFIFSLLWIRFVIIPERRMMEARAGRNERRRE